MEPTQFAPAERGTPEQIEAQVAVWESQTLLKRILDSCSFPIVALNEQRQMVCWNRAMVALLGTEAGVAGKRHGEALFCIHARETAGGCGTTEHCAACGAIQAILDAQGGLSNKRECRITAGSGSLDLSVSCEPLTLGEQRFVVLSLADIGDEKRRSVLERIFYHDILNTIGVANSLALSLKGMVPPGEAAALANLLSAAVEEAVTEIKGQRQLAAAETGELTVEPERVRTLSLVEEIASRYRGLPAGRDLSIEIDGGSEDVAIASDRSLLGHVLGNMLKNALEATPKGQTVTIGCRTDGQDVEFWVHNPGVMPPEARLQVFQRSFSTKGPGRGLGTYGMKLLSERYLRGQVGFRSAEGAGTTFVARYPRTLEEAKPLA